jgi:polysaccharide biosynthesis/export protein
MIRYGTATLAMCVLALASGCHAIDFYTPTLQSPVPPELEPPRELSMVSLPAYRIEPPDMIRIEMIKAVPRNPYRIGPSDALMIRCLRVLPSFPINKPYTVEADGTLVLGTPYGSIRVEGLTIEEAEAALTRLLKVILAEPAVSIQVIRSAAADQLTGVYPVEADGTLNLRNYGMINVAGKTVAEAREAVQAVLNRYFDSPQVGVEVVQYNSKSYYVIMESVLANGTVWRFPITGNETVLDAIAQVERVSNIASKKIWVVRRAPADFGREQILPVNWDQIAHGALTATNYQILPGDRIYVASDSAVAANYVVNKLFSPVERLLGISSLGTEAALGTQTMGRAYNSHGRRGSGQ